MRYLSLLLVSMPRNENSRVELEEGSIDMRAENNASRLLLAINAVQILRHQRRLQYLKICKVYMFRLFALDPGMLHIERSDRIFFKPVVLKNAVEFEEQAGRWRSKKHHSQGSFSYIIFIYRALFMGREIGIEQARQLRECIMDATVRLEGRAVDFRGNERQIHGRKTSLAVRKNLLRIHEGMISWIDVIRTNGLDMPRGLGMTGRSCARQAHKQTQREGRADGVFTRKVTYRRRIEISFFLPQNNRSASRRRDRSRACHTIQTFRSAVHQPFRP